MISPAKFIPIAVETGLINPIGECVLRESVDQMQKWNDTLPDDFKISVN